MKPSHAFLELVMLSVACNEVLKQRLGIGC
jgi:hypothetical protein